MNFPKDKLRDIIVQGWMGMLSLLLLMMLTDLTEAGMKGDFSSLLKDPGMKGLWFIVVMVSANVLVQISVRAFEGKSFRWAVFGLTAFYTLVFIGHQATHLMAGEGFDIHFILDIVHHVLGFWASMAAYRWAKASEDVVEL
jgi:hypothetical protein